MRLVLAAIITVVILSPALASHAPGARTWQGIVNSDETVNPKCKQWTDGACVKS